MNNIERLLPEKNCLPLELLHCKRTPLYINIRDQAIADCLKALSGKVIVLGDIDEGGLEGLLNEKCVYNAKELASAIMKYLVEKTEGKE